MNSRDVDYVDSIVDKVDYRVTIDKEAPSTVTQVANTVNIRFLNQRRLGQLCHVNAIILPSAATRIKMLKGIALSVKASWLFNPLPRYLRDCKGLGLDNFKLKLDKFLGITPDEPKLPQYHLGASSNSIVD
ncbi:hypothetical protein Pcinc_004525 [Petrolisthes cinctipes]|uniref:Uncharacterized protein n=1 Tax=Petrolisthes cinctipes TaxID=88211 RepID=A0AAE1L0Z7_PETCI|nr:hypothetical protein Pcinc_004525 [Petrolisthes cinctipes]